MVKFVKERLWPAMKFIGNEKGIAWLAAIPAIASVASNIFGSKDKGDSGGSTTGNTIGNILSNIGKIGGLFGSGGGTTTEQRSSIPLWQEQLGMMLGQKSAEGLSDLTLGQQYPNNLTSQMTPYETQGLDWLTQYLQGGMGSTYDLAKTELERTLKGGYDPYTSPYYQALRTGAGRELEDALTQSKRGAGYRGQFFSEGAQRDESTLREGATNYLQQILGQLAENERQRQYGAIGTGLEFEKYAAGLPLAKAAGAMEYGAIPRLIEKQNMEKAYEEWKRARQEPINIAQNTFGRAGTVGYQDYATAPSTFERIMSGLSSGGGQAVGNLWDIFTGKKQGTPINTGSYIPGQSTGQYGNIIFR